MASVRQPETFYTHGTSAQFEFVLSLYPDALRLKAQEKNKKVEELQKLDTWYQEELPKKLKARGKEAHLTHEELVQCMKWKLWRGQWRQGLLDLVQINTPRAVETATKKAFRQVITKGYAGLNSAIQNLAKLKGISPATASGILAAAAPETAPFMADECLMAIPAIEGIDYTANEYLKYAQHIKELVDRLNGENDKNTWNPHRVELALWAHFVISKLQPSLLDNIPGLKTIENGSSSGDSSKDPAPDNGKTVLDKDSEDSTGSLVPAEDLSDATNDSTLVQSEESREAQRNGHDAADETEELPAAKKMRLTNDSEETA